MFWIVGNTTLSRAYSIYYQGYLVYLLVLLFRHPMASLIKRMERPKPSQG